MTLTMPTSNPNVLIPPVTNAVLTMDRNRQVASDARKRMQSTHAKSCARSDGTGISWQPSGDLGTPVDGRKVERLRYLVDRTNQPM